MVRRGASIGSGAVIMCGVEIGARAMVGAGAVVTRDVPPGAVVTGNPARVRRSASPRQPDQTSTRRFPMQIRFVDLVSQDSEIRERVER